MDFIRGVSRAQGVLFPERLEDYISEDNPVRFIDAFVEGLDLEELGFNRTTPAWTGRRPYSPQDFLKLYIYGYLNKVRSSRKLEQETVRNVEVMWLLCKLSPDYKTIADFRKDNRAAFQGVFRSFTLLCGQLDLFGGNLIAVDGSKFKAVNSPNRHFTKDQLKKRVQDLDKKIDQYLQDLDDTDAKEASTSSKDKTSPQDKIKKMKEQQTAYTHLLSDLEESGENQVSLTDADSRSMPKSPKAKVGYNVQTAVDDKHHLIVEQDVTNEANDKAQLSKISIKAKETMAVEELTVVADRGYYNSPEIKVCEENDITPYVPKPDTSSAKSRGLYSKDQFIYAPDQDHYICPAGQVLAYTNQAPYPRKTSKPIIKKNYKSAACKTCTLRSVCTTNKKGREITRWEHEHILEHMAQRLKDHPEMMKKRGALVEHPFGTIKFWNDQYHFLLKGLEKVKAEFSLMTLAYNIKRAIKEIGVSRMIEALR